PVISSSGRETGSGKGDFRKSAVVMASGNIPPGWRFDVSLSLGDAAVQRGRGMGWAWVWRRRVPSPRAAGSAEPAGCPKHPASARPALGGRFTLGLGRALASRGLGLTGLQGETSHAGGGEAVPRLF